MLNKCTMPETVLVIYRRKSILSFVYGLQYCHSQTRNLILLANGQQFSFLRSIITENCNPLSIIAEEKWQGYTKYVKLSVVSDECLALHKL